MCSSFPHLTIPKWRKDKAVLRLVVICAVAISVVSADRPAIPKFFPDDPIQADDDRAFDASAAKPVQGSNAYDFVEHTFLKRGDRRRIQALNINTMDEVPDSTWFTNRIGRHEMSIGEIVRGPNRMESLSVDGWPIVEGKSEGVTPGYRVVDPLGRTYQIKFDPPGNAEMGSGAEVIGAAFYHAIGYNVVEGYIVEIDPERIVIGEGASTIDERGRKRALTRDDVVKLLERAARQPDGTYRALASRFADGKYLGHFKYYGTRPDDPNDIFPHEHRRELRGNRVFAAWLNHDDSRGLNTLDMLEGPEGRKYIRHYMFDFGSIMGSGSVKPQALRAGNEYMLEWRPSLLTLVTLGLYVRPWILVRYPEAPPSVGRFESAFFGPERWKPEYPNPAFDNMEPEDAFWAARIVSRFSDEAIRAVVDKARYSEPGAAEHISRTLVERRDKVLRAWLTTVNPVVEPSLDDQGLFRFKNAAVDAGMATPPDSYVLQWCSFDNSMGLGDDIGSEVVVSEPEAAVPMAHLHGRDFVSVSIRTFHSEHPHWSAPVRVYFRRAVDGWQPVGLERRPEENR
jgi:hypothetical protein